MDSINHSQKFILQLTDDIIHQIVMIYCDCTQINSIKARHMPTVSKIIRDNERVVERRFGSYWSGHSKLMLNPIYIAKRNDETVLFVDSSNIYFFPNMSGDPSLSRYQSDITAAEKKFKKRIHTFCQKLYQQESQFVHISTEN